MDYFPYNLEYSSFSDTKSRERQSQAIELPYPNELPFVSWAQATISLHVAGKHQKGLRKVIKARTFNSAFVVGWESTVNHLQPPAFKPPSTAISCPYSTFSFQPFPTLPTLTAPASSCWISHWPLSAGETCIPEQYRFLDHQPREVKRLAGCPRKPEGSSILSSARDILTFLMPPFPHIWIENNFAKHPEILAERIRYITLREKEMPKCDILNDCSTRTFETSAT